MLASIPLSLTETTGKDINRIKTIAFAEGKSMRLPVKGKRLLMPCFWVFGPGSVPVGEGALGKLHPQCLLAIGLFGLFDTLTPRTFEYEFCQFLEKRTQQYPLLQTLYNVIPSPAVTRPGTKETNVTGSSNAKLMFPFQSQSGQITTESSFTVVRASETVG